MGINISQFNPPATVSNLVWDDDMTAGAGKIFRGDLSGNVTGYASKVWIASPAAASDIEINVPSGYMQLYQLPPKNTLSGVIRIHCYADCTIMFLAENMTVIQSAPLPLAAADMTIPAGTNGIYVKSIATSSRVVYLAAMTVT